MWAKPLEDGLVVSESLKGVLSVVSAHAALAYAAEGQFGADDMHYGIVDRNAAWQRDQNWETAEKLYGGGEIGMRVCDSKSYVIAVFVFVFVLLCCVVLCCVLFCFVLFCFVLFLFLFCVLFFFMCVFFFFFWWSRRYAYRSLCYWALGPAFVCSQKRHREPTAWALRWQTQWPLRRTLQAGRAGRAQRFPPVKCSFMSQ